MTSLTFYGGVNEIGGNKILLEDRDTRIFLDFGKSFSRRSRYFEGYLSPRTANGIVDFLEMGLVPKIKGAYRDDLLKMAGREPEEPEIDAVLLSHAHADHADYISFLHEKIPIHMGETCSLILQALQERRNRSIEHEILDYKPRPYKSKDEPIPRKIEPFRTGDRFTIGSMEIEPIHVDHSVPGAYGFIIHTSAGPVVYTGDIRLHGTNPQMTRDFIDKAKEVKPIALIAEGTRIGDTADVQESEERVYKESHDIVSNTSQLVFADFNFKDMDRARTFYRIAKENGRKFVVKLDDAYFLKYLSQDPVLGVPDVDDDNIIIYMPKRGSGTHADDDYPAKYAEFLKLDNRNTCDDIKEQKDKVLCAMGFYNFTTLIDIKPAPGAVYIHSASEPYNEEQELSSARMENWLDHFGLQKFQCHCSGHAKGKDLLDVVSEIDAKVLYPVHSEQPDLYRKVSKNMVDVEEATRYDLA